MTEKYSHKTGWWVIFMKDFRFQLIYQLWGWLAGGGHEVAKNNPEKEILL